MSLQYADFFENNENWLDWSPNPNIAIKTTYPEFFHDGQHLHLAFLKEWLFYKKKIDCRLHTKSKDLFKALFKMPDRLVAHRANELSFCVTLSAVSRRFGSIITAHGVEEQKGGLYNLLLMCVSGTITIPKQSWGKFIDGMPNISPRGHGPYYIIHSTKSGLFPKNNQPLSEVEYILVPFAENISHLTHALTKMVAIGFIDLKQQIDFTAKLIDYEAFGRELLQTRPVKQAPKPMPKSSSKRLRLF